MLLCFSTDACIVWQWSNFGAWYMFLTDGTYLRFASGSNTITAGYPYSTATSWSGLGSASNTKAIVTLTSSAYLTKGYFFMSDGTYYRCVVNFAYNSFVLKLC